MTDERRLTYVGGTSIFDPVLCELAYLWFCPPGGKVLDPFAGGSVRGIVAAKLGRKYTGIELRKEQVDANREQAARICAGSANVQAPADVPVTDGAMTPIKSHGGYKVKRDDLFEVAGIRGGKARACQALALGAPGLVTAGSRSSPQVNIVARIAKHMGVPCRVHVPTGQLSPEVQEAQDAGAEVLQHSPGHNSVIVARAREDASRLGWVNIPFGMECKGAVAQTRKQAENVAEAYAAGEFSRLVVPVGSGMSLAGILHGLKDTGCKIPVLGVVVGADPTKRLDKYAPKDWKRMVTLRKSGSDYHSPAGVTQLGDLQLDPIYEAKCIPHIQTGDCLWVVGVRHSLSSNVKPQEACDPPEWIIGDSRNAETLAQGQFDFVFSCPPYADREKYSDNPADLSTLEYPKFRDAYREIIAACVRTLKDNRFACFVVGEVRGPGGNYYGFVPDTIRAFEDAGCRYYNEAILVTAIGSLPIRAGSKMQATRKIGKTHQNVLVFVKGDGHKAATACGPVDFAEPNAQDGAEESDG